MLFGFDKACRLSSPYPVISQDNILPVDIFEELMKEFPTAEDFSLGACVMGGRNRLSSDEESFYKFLDKSKVWSSFYKFINSSEFIRPLLYKFEDDIKRNNLKIDLEEVEVDENYLYKKAKLLRMFPQKAVSAFFKIKSSLSDRNQLYVHFDISSAENGYKREIHRDSDPRILAFLIYFNDDYIQSGGGGEFGIYRYYNDSEREIYESQPDENEMEEVVLIDPKPNQALAFLSVKNSYHGVPEMKGCDATRKFIYVGVSRKRSGSWCNS